MIAMLHHYGSLKRLVFQSTYNHVMCSLVGVSMLFTTMGSENGGALSFLCSGIRAMVHDKDNFGL